MRITIFKSLFDTEAEERDVSWSDLVASIGAPRPYPAKADCPLIKLARFGPTRNPKGYLRNNANVTAVTGIELDYDGEVVPLTEAAERFRAAGVEAVLYSSASSAPGAPRWRAFLPLTGEYTPDYREAFYEAADAVLGGICAAESATLSQAFYIGQIQGQPYEAIHVPGAFLDTLTTPTSRPLNHIASVDVPEFEHVPLDTLPLSPDILALIKAPPVKGQNSERLMTVANAMAKAQIPPATILRVLADPENPISAKALTRRSPTEAMDWLARFTVAKALERFPPYDLIFPPMTGKRIDRKQLLHGANALSSQPNPARWLVRGILEQECFAVLYGPSSAGKSLLTIDMAACIATGVQFHERTITQGPVVYVSGEGNNGLSRRLKAWRIAHPDTPLTDDFLITSRAVHFREPESLRELINDVDALPKPPVLIVIDTYMRANAGGDENSARDAAEFVKLCDKLKERYSCTVLLVAHSGKSNTDSVMGSTVIRNAADVEMSFRRLEQKEPKHVSALKCTKMKDAEPFEELYFKLTPQELGWFDPETKEQIISWTFTELDPPDALPRTETAVIFVRCLGSKSIGYEKTREAFFQLYPAGEKKAKQKAWDRILAKAIDQGWCSYDKSRNILEPHPAAVYRDGIDISKEVAS